MLSYHSIINPKIKRTLSKTWVVVTFITSLTLLTIIVLFSTYIHFQQADDSLIKTPFKQPKPWLSHNNKLDFSIRDLTDPKHFPERLYNVFWLQNESFLYLNYTSNKIFFFNPLLHQKKLFLDLLGFNDFYSSGFTSNKDSSIIALKSNVFTVFRHSEVATYNIYGLKEKKVIKKINNVQFLTFGNSKSSELICYVKENNIYYENASSAVSNPIKITSDQNKTGYYNGISDWVYEEEVLADNRAMWVSPDDKNIAYLSFNDYELNDYKSLVYKSPFGSRFTDYPIETTTKYPKTNYSLPRVVLSVYNFESKEEIVSINFEADIIVSDVLWAKDSKNILIRQLNRQQNLVTTSVLDIIDKKKNSVRVEKAGYDPVLKVSDGGWYKTDSHNLIVYQNQNKQNMYLDIIVNSGYYHIASYAFGSAHPNTIVTSGKYEVRSILGVDEKENTVFYTSAEKNSMASTVFKSDLSGKNKEVLSPDGKHHTYDNANLSPNSKFMIVEREGPSVPKTFVKSIQFNKTTAMLENTALENELKNYNLPLKRYKKVKVNNVIVNVVEIVPFDFSEENEYGVLFSYYGGPESQKVSFKFELDFHAVLVSMKRDLIVVIMDQKGTCCMGRNFSTVIRKELGKTESEHQISFIKSYSKLKYTDKTKIGIWGWSYGGFLTCKIVEKADPGLIKLAVAVAPVTDWAYYDAVYTERYMDLLDNNREGYQRSKIKITPGFNSTKFVLMHGTNDDNVHFQNSLSLIDQLVQNKVYNYSFYPFVDDLHSISTPASNSFLYNIIYKYVQELL